MVKVIRKKYIKRSLILSAIHLGTTLFLIVFSFGITMDVFDNPDAEVPIMNPVYEYAVKILMQPVLSIWTPWMSKHMPDELEWILFLLNSIFWGLGLSLIWQLIKRGEQRRHATQQLV